MTAESFVINSGDVVTVTIPDPVAIEVVGVLGPRGASIDDVAIAGDAAQFYSEGQAVGDPIPLLFNVIDGGTVTSSGAGYVDGGTP